MSRCIFVKRGVLSGGGFVRGGYARGGYVRLHGKGSINKSLYQAPHIVSFAFKDGCGIICAYWLHLSKGYLFDVDYYKF